MMNDPVQVAKSFDVSGRWVKWSRYDLLNGVVVPARNAKLEQYDPWQQFRSNAGKYRTVEQPYVALLELHRNLKQAESNGIQPSQLHSRYFLGGPLIGPKNEADDLVLAWCNKHGLLGLVSVLSNSIRPPIEDAAIYVERGLEYLIQPAKQDQEGEGRIIGLPGSNHPEDAAPKVCSTHHFRPSGEWSTATWFFDSTSELETALAEKREPRPKKPSVTWFNWRTGLYEKKPLKAIRDFFLPTPFGSAGEVQEQVPIPCPNSRSFWDVYGEPIRQFTSWCERFTKAVDLISGWGEGGAALYSASLSLRSDLTLTASGAVTEAHGVLFDLARTAAPNFRWDSERNTVDENRVCPGLLASYALMFLWDRMEGRRALSCRNCSRYFVSDERHARYCSPRCRNTAQKRRSRAKVVKK